MSALGRLCGARVTQRGKGSKQLERELAGALAADRARRRSLDGTDAVRVHVHGARRRPPGPAAGGLRTRRRRSITKPASWWSRWPTGSRTTQIPLRGSITYAPENDFSRVIAFVHGRHAVCLGTPSPGQQVCDDLVDDNGTPIQTDVRSYGGYDYMASNLASHGYVVMSLEANTSNFDNGFTRRRRATRARRSSRPTSSCCGAGTTAPGPYVPGEPAPHGRHQARRQAQLRRGHRPDGPLARRRRGHRLHRLHAQPHAAVGLPALHARRRAGARAGQLHADARCRTAPTTACCCPPATATSPRCQGARFFENAKYPTSPRRPRSTPSRRSSGTSRAPTTTSSTRSGRRTTPPPPPTRPARASSRPPRRA